LATMTVTPTREAAPRQPMRVSAPLWARRVLPSVADLFFLAIFLLFTLAPWAAALLRDTSTGWHIRTGEMILRTHAIPRVDPFSYTMAGQPWYAWEWLWDALNGAMHLRFGLSGVVAVGAFVLALTFALVYRAVSERSNTVLIAVTFTLLALAASSIHMLARPHIASWLLTVVVLRELQALAQGSRRPMWTLPLVFAVWANVHGGFVMGLAVVATFAIAEVLERKPLMAKKFGALLGLCALATIVNPYGLKLHAHVVAHLASRLRMDNIDEFLSPNFHATGPRFFLLLVLIAIATLFSAKTVRWRELLLVLLAIATGLLAARNIPSSAIILAFAVAPLAAEWLRNSRFQRLAAIDDRTRETDRVLRAHVLPAIAVAVVLCAFATGYRLPHATWDPAHVPARSAEYLVQHLGARDRAFVPDYWTGYVIYKYSSQGFRVAIDDRFDFYGDARFRQYLEMTRAGRDWRRVAEDWQLRYALIAADSPMRATFTAARDWRGVYADSQAAIFVRNAAPAPNDSQQRVRP
jgi:hypothetical protein